MNLWNIEGILYGLGSVNTKEERVRIIYVLRYLNYANLFETLNYVGKT